MTDSRLALRAMQGWKRLGGGGPAPRMIVFVADGDPLDANDVAAAYTALTGVVGASPFLTNSYGPSLVTHNISVLDPGLAFGESVANRILALRENDGAALAAYIYLPADAGDVGVWTPVSAAPAAQSLLPGWGSVTPWVLRSGSQFRPDPPPALDSERYASDYNEIFQIGPSMNSTRWRRHSRNMAPSSLG